MPGSVFRDLSINPDLNKFLEVSKDQVCERSQIYSLELLSVLKETSDSSIRESFCRALPDVGI